MKKKVLMAMVTLMCLFLSGAVVRASDVSPQEIRQLIQTIQELKAKVDALEKKVQEYEARQKRLEASVEEVKEVKEELKTKASHLEKIQEALGNLKIGADVTLIGQGTMNNDKNRGDKDVQDATLSYDLELETQIWERGTAYMLIEGGNGQGVDEEVPTLSGINDDAPGDTAAEVTEAWYEQEVPLGRAGTMVFTLGKVDLTNYFDANEVANDETSQFFSSGFVNNLAVEWPDDNGIGARVTWSPVEWLDVSLGWAEAQGDWEDIFDDGFGIVEVDFKAKPMGLPGNYRIYAWVNGKDHLDVDDLRKVGRGRLSWSQVEDDRMNWGVGFSIDQKVHRGITLFARGGLMDEEVVAGSREEESVDTVPMKGAYSLGFQIEGLYWGREADVLGVAFGGVLVNDDAQDLYREVYYDYYKDPGDIDMENEYHLEVYYKLSFFEGKLEFSPDVQVIWNPNGNGDAPTVTVVGTRMQVNF